MAAEAMPQIDDGELMMVNTLVVRQDWREDYLVELRRIIPEARLLPACLSLEVGEVAAEPGTFVLSERWRSGTEYVQQILQLPIYRRYLAASESMYAEPRRVLVLTAVGPVLG